MCWTGGGAGRHGGPAKGYPAVGRRQAVPPETRMAARRDPNQLARRRTPSHFPARSAPGPGRCRRPRPPSPDSLRRPNHGKVLPPPRLLPAAGLAGRGGPDDSRQHRQPGGGARGRRGPARDGERRLVGVRRRGRHRGAAGRHRLRRPAGRRAQHGLRLDRRADSAGGTPGAVPGARDRRQRPARGVPRRRRLPLPGHRRRRRDHPRVRRHDPHAQAGLHGLHEARSTPRRSGA